jgi:hypothetical protein
VARIECERAAREKAEKDRQAEEETAKAVAQSQMVNEMAKATAKGKTKGVRDIWVIEVVDETLIPEQYKTYDPKKARAYVEAGFSKEKDAEKIIPGLRCYKALNSTGR